jgi:hypothetical protein
MTGPNRRVSQRAGLTFAAILALAPAVQAGVNTWSGGRPTPELEPGPGLIATDPRDPYVVYAAFQPHLYKARTEGPPGLRRSSKSWTVSEGSPSIQPSPRRSTSDSRAAATRPSAASGAPKTPA